MLTWAQAYIKRLNKHLEEWCAEKGFKRVRMSKLINGTPGYVAQEHEKAAMGDWLGLPADLVFEDAGPVLEKYAAEFLARRKKSAESRGSARSRGAGSR